MKFMEDAEKKGMLYLCATPIGNLADVSARCVEVMKSADLIAAEDTRRTLGLLNHFGISKPLTSYHEHNKRDKGKYLVGLMKEGKNIALVSDAGTPAISDPGEDLVALCIENGIDVTSVPGPVACVNALILSGLPAARFAFEGFLSTNNKNRRAHLEAVKNDTHTLIFYEAPHKLKYTLEDMLRVFGNRRIALCRELTKLHEEIIRTDIEGALEYYREKAPRGEYVLVIEGAPEGTGDGKSFWWSGLLASAHVEAYIERGLSPKDAVKQTAADRGVPKREIYNEYHGLKR